MMFSQTIATIAPLLLKAQKEMGDAKKGSSNPFFKSSYADLNTIREVAIPVLNNLGISVLQPNVSYEGKNFVRTLLLHESGEFIVSDTEIVHKLNDPQAHGSGITYARRYGLQSLLNIGAVDDDAEAAMGRSNTKPTQTTQASSLRKTDSLEKPATTSTNVKAEASSSVKSEAPTTTESPVTKTSSFRKPVGNGPKAWT